MNANRTNLCPNCIWCFANVCGLWVTLSMHRFTKSTSHMLSCIWKEWIFFVNPRYYAVLEGVGIDGATYIIMCMQFMFNPRVHPSEVRWNLRSIKKFPTPNYCNLQWRAPLPRPSKRRQELCTSQKIFLPLVLCHCRNNLPNFIS